LIKPTDELNKTKTITLKYNNMKKLVYVSILLTLAAACTPKTKDKAAELADLKKQQADISAKIAQLQSEVGKKDSVKSTDVSAFTVKATNFTNYVSIQGRIDAQDNVTAYPQASAAITAIYVKVGDHVSKGETLVQLDNSVLRQNIEQAQSQANLAQTLYQRQKNLWDQKIGTEVQFLQAQTNLQSTEKQVASLRQQADLYRIISPISGTIDQMDLKLGQIAAPGGAGIRVVNADILKVKADVPESYSGSIHQGDNVKILVPDANDSVTAKVTFAAKVIDQSSRSFAIEIKLPSGTKFRPNMTAVLQIANYTSNKAIVVPAKAVQKSENGDYVFINVNGFAKRKIVTEGATSNGMIEIKSGVTAGDIVITEGASELEDGDKVKVLPGN
jgi:membrane fusion protein (multidrug efflux system)